MMSTRWAHREGAGVGIAWTGMQGGRRGPLVTLAIALHNIPEVRAC